MDDIAKDFMNSDDFEIRQRITQGRIANQPCLNCGVEGPKYCLSKEIIPLLSEHTFGEPPPKLEKVPTNARFTVLVCSNCGFSHLFFAGFGPFPT